MTKQQGRNRIDFTALTFSVALTLTVIVFIFLLGSTPTQAHTGTTNVTSITLPNHSGSITVVPIGLTPDHRFWNLDRNGNDALGSTKAGHLRINQWMTPLPGQGNTVIVGHSWASNRNTPFGSLFATPLQSIVTVRTADGGVFKYRLANRLIVPTRSSWVISQKENRLTLITSNDDNSRLVLLGYPCVC